MFMSSASARSPDVAGSSVPHRTTRTGLPGADESDVTLPTVWPEPDATISTTSVVRLSLPFMRVQSDDHGT
jgi:hypothetical protein